ncbi:MAG: HlyD family type I secretion periplasmic adaptor subunit [Burkholderiaceae bacterium]|nr:HlyD family type I secretion periplasmic adaptor subunit [Burkholderiaceae bacterium]
MRLEKSQPQQPKRNRAELEFLPAALEITESPPSPTGRMLAWFLMALFVLAILWAIFGRVDVVAVASGKIVPSGRTKVIQPLELGVIRELHVRDGQQVKAGEVLIQLDPTNATADRDRLDGDLLATRMELARLKAARSDKSFLAPSGAGTEAASTNVALLESQKREHEARLAALDSEIKRKGAERRASQASIVKLEKLLIVTQERVDIRREYYEKGFFSRLQLLEAEQTLIEQEQQLQVEQHREQESVEAIASLERQRSQAQAEFMRGVLSQMAEGERRASGFKQDLVKAEQRQSAQTLAAPIDGVVQQLAVHTVGGVVSPAQTLMVIVPKDDPLEIEARVQNLDIGFVRAGQPVEVKLETFQFTKYGTIPGVVESVSGDAVQDEGRGLVYLIRVKLERSQMNVNGQQIDLAPGMAATVEIKTGSRRLIEYILSPILRYKQESLRER